jgi:hypothetical protein
MPCLTIRFLCPACERAAAVRVEGAQDWTCAYCGQPLRIQPEGSEQGLEACAICGNSELYKKKNFPHWLGLSILVSASLLFLVAQAIYWQWLGWAIFIGSAIIDGLLYLWVGDVIVCYRCQAHYGGIAVNSRHAPYDLATAERYRQERLRKSELRSSH